MDATPKSSPAIALLSIAALAVMAALDYFTGQELVFSCAYLLPVAITAWWFRRRWMIAMAIASGVTAFLVDIFDGIAYSRPGIEWWNAFTCFFISIVTGLILSRLRETLRERQTANEALRSALANLEASTVEIRKLQAGLQTVCAWTKRIKVGDRWMAPDEFLTTQLHLSLTHTISPDAARELTGNLSQAA